jgi:hypothetical protein
MRSLALVACLLLFSGAASAEDGDKGFAVLELFTSEGCPSCPAAEELLKQIRSRAIERGEPIYTLAFHVDYFNSEDWADPFSKASYSERHKKYASVHRETLIYTPQLIVNGRHGFNGADADQATKRIEDALESTPKASVSMAVTAVRDSEGKLTSLVLEPSVEGPKNSVVHIASVEDGLVAHSPQGETNDHTESRDGVVRGMWSVPVKKLGGKFAVEWPNEVDPSRASLIAYVQSRVLRVQAATRVSVP